MTPRIAEVDGGRGVVILGTGRIVTVVTIELDTGGRIVSIRAVANPDKLVDVAAGHVRDVGAYRST
jgi:hypothetical protein